ncbi:hypothetical protein XccvBFoX1_gp43 [Xanthomonas phage FoX1]|uniref:Uncharacterized protein n=1 Tax=Xanthomonas phage FoX1 TaxID=2723897 RepID=A0A858NPB6_9CAUD|nr:hypothetical protein KNU93_gp67 [Xanthomonas phage FoX1]QJB21782.1 hypothetical protein XccvBFoX1_gp43 [Xanthomonas phage FoX1]
MIRRPRKHFNPVTQLVQCAGLYAPAIFLITVISR